MKTSAAGRCGTRRVCQVPELQHKLFTFGTCTRDMSKEESERLIEAHIHATLQSTGFGGALREFTVTTAVRPPPASGMNRVPQTASSHDLLFVHHFESEAGARAALQTADYAHIQVAENGLVDWETRVVLLCRCWVLKGDLG